MLTSMPCHRRLSTTRSFLVLALLFMGFSALGQPQRNRVQLDVCTWNVDPRDFVGISSPEGRVADLITFSGQRGIDLIGFQEVPQSVFNSPGRMQTIRTAATNAGYDLVEHHTEYPPYTPGRGNRTNARTTSVGYLIAYNRNVLTPVSANPGAAQTVFADPIPFQEGLNQARPPIISSFQLHHGQNQNSRLDVLVWHNEAGTSAADHIVQFDHYAANVLEPNRRSTTNPVNWLLMGDLNVRDTTAEMQSIEASHHVLVHDDSGIDYIVAPSPIADIINGPPPNAVDPRFRIPVPNRHIPLFGRIDYQ